MVIPKSLRERAGLHGPAEIEVEFDDGRIVLGLPAVEAKVARRGGRPVLVFPPGTPRLSIGETREAVERLREKRGG